MKDFERYAAKITEQIFDLDNAFFIENGIDPECAIALDKHGTYGGIQYTPTSSPISILTITLEASDLYTVEAIVRDAYTAPNVIDLHTKKPVQVTKSERTIRFERVFLFDLINVLHAIFYRDGNL